MAGTKGSADRELAAISSILKALNSLDGESIQRVLDYVFGRLSIAAPRHVKPGTPIAAHSATSVEPSLIRRPSIRDLKEEKQPESSNQMAALVAYYLSEITEDAERKEEVNTADLEKYFKQAGFKLPKSLSQTLSNATAAGYFDPTGNGLYKLNAVGYNLAAHGLPRGHSSSPTKRKSQKPKKKSKASAR
jgi:hypothetical protein